MRYCLSLLFCLASSLGICQQNRFSLQIYKASIVDSSNLFISPYSVREALLVLGTGARGSTRKELDSLIGSGGIDHAQRLEVANSVWTNNHIHIKTDFVQRVTDDYHSEHFSFNPANVNEAGDRVNKWVTEKTHGKINDMPGPQPGDAVVIINAIYFKGSWSVRFRKRQTKPRSFNAIDGTRQELPTMFSNEMYRYFENEDLQALSLPYKDDFEMTVLLPRKDVSLKDIEATMDNATIDNIRRGLRSHPVSVFLPKFELKTEIDVRSSLETAGFVKVFSSTADYTGITEDSHVVPGALIHKTFISIDEKQTEAAAVTEMVVTAGPGPGDPSSPPEPRIFRADHPFMFLLTDTMTGDILFIGRFVKGKIGQL